MTTYAFRSPSGDITAMHPMLAMPTPAHALTPGALAAVEAVREQGRRRRLDAVMARVVTDVGRPRVLPYDGVVVTDGARQLAKLGEAAGFEIKLLTGADWCRVEGLLLERRVGFRATWKRGVASGSSWHEPWRYALVPDDRPIAVDSRSKVGKVGFRSPGMGTTRLSIVGCPAGLPINVTALKARIRALDAT